MLSIHLLLAMHHLLIHRLLVMTSAHVFVSFVHFGLVPLSGVIVAMNIFSFVFVPVFFTAHSCSLAVFGDLPRFVLAFSRSGFGSSANAFAVLRALALVE